MRFRFFKKILDAKSAINTTSDELSSNDLAGVSDLTYYIVFGAGTSAGAIQPETSHLKGYTGTWAAEGNPIAWAAASSVKIVRITGTSFIGRVRISTGIVGGTVDVYAVGRG